MNGSETDTSLAVGRDTARRSENRTTAGRVGGIGRLFRAIAKALTTQHEDAPPPPKKSGRGRGDETRRAQFVKVAKRLTHLRLRPISKAASALIWLTDALDWLDLWRHNELTDDAPQGRHNNHLSPRL